MPRLPQVLNPDGAARAAGKGAMPRLPHVNPDAGAARAGGTSTRGEETNSIPTK